MHKLLRPWLVIGLMELTSGMTAGQAPAAVPAPAPVAAVVNGQPITEVAVQRALGRVPPEGRAQARAEVMEFLVNNLLIDQYLQKLPNIAVAREEVDKHLDKVRADLKKSGQDFDKVLKDLMVTEEELRAQISADLRWEKFATSQVTDAALQDHYEKNRSVFDGSMVQARHILLAVEGANAEARAQLQQLRKQIDDEVARGLAKLPPTADNLAREKERVRLVNESFATLAKAHSACPSKENGGDIGLFPRAGSLVEPFARAAFDLKPHQVSDVVTTQFGQHLILVTDRKPGKEIKFEDVKAEVREVYFEKVRENLVAQLRQRAAIEIKPAPKP